MEEPNSLFISQIRRCVKTIWKEQTEDLTTLEIFVKNCQKIKHLSFRFIWVIVGMACLITCFYQIYERVSYYLTIPVVTYTTISDDLIKLPHIRVQGIPTDGLKPHWEYAMKTLKYPSTRCLLFTNLFMKINVKNYTEFWMAINATSNIKNIALKINKRIASNITFINGHISKSSNLKLIKWNTEFSYFGPAITFRLVNNFKWNSLLMIDLTDSGYCKNPYIQLSVVNQDYFARDRSINVHFGELREIKFSIRKYKFLNTANSPCENNDKNTNQCYLQCLTQKFRNLQCWLPFMPIESKIVECTELRNVTITMNVYASSINLLYYFTLDSCSCLKTCKHSQVYIQYFSSHLKNSTVCSLHFSRMDNVITEISEHLSFDFISLLENIAGSLGLFLGISLLSIAKVMQSFTVFVGKFQTNQKILSHYPHTIVKNFFLKIFASRQMQLKHHKWIKLIKKLILLAMLILTTLLIYDKINYKFQDPINKVITLNKTKKIHAPNFIACREEKGILTLKQQFAKENGIDNYCKVHFLDLLDLKHPKVSIKMLWNLSSLYGITQPTKIIETVYGSCHETMFRPSQFYLRGNSLRLHYYDLGNCCEETFRFYLRNRESSIHSTILNQLDIFARMHNILVIEIVLHKRLNLKTKPCMTHANYEKCMKDCFKRKSETFGCRLPFIRNVSNLQFCSNSSSAKISFKNYFKIISDTYINNHCNCHKKCQLTIYKIHWVYSNPSPWDVVMIHINLVDLIETLTEIAAQSSIGLLCDIGNIMGITLGVSVLSCMDIVLSVQCLQSNLIYLKKLTKI